MADKLTKLGKIRTNRQRIQIVLDQLLEPFAGSIPNLSRSMGIHRSTLHYAMRRGHLSYKLQRKIIEHADRYMIEIDLKHIIG